MSELRAEIIAVGTELIVGETVNSNATWLSQKLAQLGVDVYYHSAVGDNPGRIQEVFETALKRSNLIVFTGGLGPTDDDLTVKTITDYFDVTMVRDSVIEEMLKNYFITRGMPMSKTNLKQADRPEDSIVLNNPQGTAPGILWDVTDYSQNKLNTDTLRWLVFLPGVPSEMKSIWENEFEPKAIEKLGVLNQLYTRSLKFFGIGESMLGEKLRDLMAAASPSVASYVGEAEVRIRMGVKASNQEEADALLNPLEAEILNRVGDYCFGEEHDSLESVVGQQLKEKNLKVSTAESCTGGLISSRLTDVSGSSEYIDLNVIAYANSAKENLIKVNATTLINHGAVSEEVALEMAHGVKQLTKASVGLGITGIAGPTGGTEEKPVGLAWVAVVGPNGETRSKQIIVNKRYPRPKIKYWFSQYALYELWQLLKNIP